MPSKDVPRDSLPTTPPGPYRGGPLIRAARIQAGMTQAELARRVGRTSESSASWIGQIELGWIKPRTETLERIAAVLGVPVRSLMPF